MAKALLVEEVHNRTTNTIIMVYRYSNDKFQCPMPSAVCTSTYTPQALRTNAVGPKLDSEKILSKKYK